MDTTGNKTVGYGFNMDSAFMRVWDRAGVQSDSKRVYNGEQALSPAEAEAAKMQASR